MTTDSRLSPISIYPGTNKIFLTQYRLPTLDSRKNSKKFDFRLSTLAHIYTPGRTGTPGAWTGDPSPKTYLPGGVMGFGYSCNTHKHSGVIG